MTPVRSMTGFARARRPLGAGQILVSVKSVNHRGLDVHIRAPEAFDPFEVAVRALVKSHVARGHVDVRVALQDEPVRPARVSFNKPLLEQYLRVFRDAAAEYNLPLQPDLEAALRLPGVLAPAGAGDDPPEGAEAALLDALADALHEWNAFREREGAELAAEIRKHAADVSAAVAAMESLRSGAAALFQNRLAQKLHELLAAAPIDPHRLAQEAALLAERSDIGEELARLQIHSAQLLALLDQGGELGKKLDFLLQEMNREANTILSKSGGAASPGLRIAECALSAKAAIEKMREQSLNLE
ncbi:MAG TPA: YicC/YloC family endoribonuclease [Bryobacteraceae bacterium]|nr:YicC/YloC family endoribonuclease [Bryobacteraceae bacterium]